MECISVFAGGLIKDNILWLSEFVVRRTDKLRISYCCSTQLFKLVKVNLTIHLGINNHIDSHDSIFTIALIFVFTFYIHPCINILY